VNAEKIYQTKFLPTAKYLLKELDYYGEKQFKKQTPVSSWTIGQLYHHLIQGSQDYHFKAIKACLAKSKENQPKKKTLAGFFIFTFNRFPPIKSKVPNGYTPEQIENTAKAKDMMFGFLKEMQKLAIEIDKVNNNSYRVNHKILGNLTAKEWYLLISLHIEHHLTQKKKIDKILRTFTKEVE